MVDNNDIKRIAEALERLSPPPPQPADLSAHPAYRWDGQSLHIARNFAPLPWALINGIDRQKSAVLENIRRHGAGAAAHDMLLWGARGMGKSALVKSACAHLQSENQPIALIEAGAMHIESLPALFAALDKSQRRFILFIDDISFEGGNIEARILRSMLDGGAEQRPGNIRMAITSNRRNIIQRPHGSDPDEIGRDDRDDALALADRFGLKLGFQYPDQAAWLEMVAAYADHFSLQWDKADALAFARARGGQSGRVAWQYTVELAGRAGKSI